MLLNLSTEVGVGWLNCALFLRPEVILHNLLALFAFIYLRSIQQTHGVLRHRRFKQQNPLDVMLHEGMSGLLKVRIDIDCAFGWKISETMAGQNKGG